MSEIFIAVLNMSLTASYVAVAVILARLLLRKAPKIFSYALWAVVLFRMICPFSFESVLSLLPTNPEPIPQDIVTQTVPRIDSGITFVDTAVNRTIQSVVPPVEPVASISPMQIVVTVGACIWLSGIVILITYAIISYIRTKHRIFDATLVRDNIFQTDRIQTPFVIGFIRPKIYIPVGLDEKETDYIIMHERTHIRRGDHIIKVLAFMALAVHWFNPLMWVSYFLMSKDMEMSCDERVMKLSGEDIRTKYSQSLLSLSVKQSGLPNPLAFGESNVKTRIKNVLNFKKHPRLIIALAAILALTVIVGCAMNRINSGSQVNLHNINISGYEISFELPDGWSVSDKVPNADAFFSLLYNSDNFAPNFQYMYIIKDNIVVGAFTLADIGNIPEEQFEYFKENPEQNYRAVYSYLPMGSMITRGIDYKTVYESEDQREGAATDLKYYRSDYIVDNSVDFSHFKEETIESDPRINYYNKGVLGYNIDLNRFVAMEFYYDAITDEEWQHIAETLRITEETSEQNDMTDETSTSVDIDFNISIQPGQYNENPFYDYNVSTIINSVEELKSLCKDESYGYMAMQGDGTESMFVRDLSQDYNAEYFKEKAIVAVSFEYSSSSIPKFISELTKYGNYLMAWAYSFEDMSLPENEKFTSGLYKARVFLLEVNKTDVEGVTEVYPGIDGAPVIIYPDSREFASRFGSYFELIPNQSIVEYYDKSKQIKFETLTDANGENCVLKINDNTVDIDSFLWFNQIFVINDIAVITTGGTDIRSTRMYVFDLNGNTLLKVYYLNNKGMVIDSSIAVVGNKIIMRGSRLTHGPNLLMSNPYSIFSEYSDYLYHDTVYDDYEDSEVYLSDPEASAILNKDEIVSADFELAYLGNGEFSKISMTDNLQTLDSYLEGQLTDNNADNTPTPDKQNRDFFDENGFYWGRNIENTLSVAEMLENLDKNNDNRIIVYQDNPADLQDKVIHLSSLMNSTTGNNSLVKDMQTYCIIGNNANDKQAADYPFPMPTQYGVYNFFANIKYNDNSEETIYFRFELKELVVAALAPQPAGLEEEVYRFISYHHTYNIFMNNNELWPEVNTLYAIWQTYLLETAIGETFEADEKNYGWKIPAEMVTNAVSYFYDLDGNDVQYDDFYINKDNSDYLWLPDGFSPNTVWAFIQWDTLTVNNGICKFDVIFYDSPHGTNSDRGEELRTFNYQFEQGLYRESSSVKTVCYKFISATRVK